MTIVNDYEKRIVCSALKTYRNYLEHRIKVTNRRGWKPMPGEVDSNKRRLSTVDALLQRWQQPAVGQ